MASEQHFPILCAADETDAAFVLLRRRYDELSPITHRAFFRAAKSMDANDPDWMFSYEEKRDGQLILHIVPGPKFLELLMPIADVHVQAEPQIIRPKRECPGCSNGTGATKPPNRLARIIAHLRAAIREALAK